MTKVASLVRWVLYWLVIWPVTVLVLGISVRVDASVVDGLEEKKSWRSMISPNGPGIVVANHNSHLDTLVIMVLLGAARWRLRPVAAADYFLRNGFTRWLFCNVFRIIPIARTEVKKSTLREFMAPVSEALSNNEVVLLFPEGTRGEPEKMQSFKSGIAFIAKEHPEVPIIPIFLYGLGRAMPRGDGLLVPVCCTVFIGSPISWDGSRRTYMESLSGWFAEKREACHADDDW